MDQDPKENSDLLRKRNSGETNGNLSHEEPKDPPDGGFRAYAIVVGSFLTNGLIFGVINSYSLIYTVLEEQLRKDNVPNGGSSAALVGSLAVGMTFLLSPVSGVLTGLVGLRLTSVIGGTIATAGLFLSSFFVTNVHVLYFTYGIMYGLGASLAYTPSLAILGHYFKKYLGVANGIVTIGSSVFTVFMPLLMEYVINKHGLVWLFRVLAVFASGLIFCGLLFKPIPVTVIKAPKKKQGCKAFLITIVNVEIWKNRMYLFWALSMPVALFGYFVPYVHIKSFIKENFKDVNQILPLQCIATTSGIGRLFFGWLADKPRVNTILMQQIAFYVIGVLTIVLPFVQVYWLLVAISLAMGLCDGAFIALIGPIAIKLCGPANAAQAIGCMLGLAATPLSVGPPIAAYIHGLYNSYMLPFVLAGISPLLGATVMFGVRFYRHKPNLEANTNGMILRADIESSPGSLLRNGKATNQSAL